MREREYSVTADDRSVGFMFYFWYSTGSSIGHLGSPPAAMPIATEARYSTPQPPRTAHYICLGIFPNPWFNTRANATMARISCRSVVTASKTSKCPAERLSLDPKPHVSSPGYLALNLASLCLSRGLVDMVYKRATSPVSNFSLQQFHHNY
jgi:hypothetical protein